MRTVVLNKNEIYHGNLLLVNAKYPLRQEHIAGLVPAEAQFPEILLKHDAASALQLVLEKISAGDSIVPVSGYRSGEEQTSIYNDSLRDNGPEFTSKYVALPNHSEHETGMAIDLGLNQENIDFIRPDFPYDGICDEFRNAAPDYGFILRYAEDKEQITGISHEPWHFRFVGYPHSKIIKQHNFALEEYIEFIKNYDTDSRLVYEDEYGLHVEIYYIPACEEQTSVTIPREFDYQISGNNVDGFIVTVWREDHE